MSSLNRSSHCDEVVSVASTEITVSLTATTVPDCEATLYP